MVNIVKAMGWEYVGLLYVRNNYGTKGINAFRDAALKKGICPVLTVGINEQKDDVQDNTQFYRAAVDFMIKDIKVIVFFGIDER